MTNDDMTAPPTASTSHNLPEARMIQLLQQVREAQNARVAQREAVATGKAAVQELFNNGISLRQIAAVTGVPWQTIRNWATKA